MSNETNTIESLFGEPIHTYTRAQAIEDGVLVDVTRWAEHGPEGMIGGFKCPVALTANVWAAIEGIPKSLEGLNDIRGRAHDVLWMASLAAKSAAKRKASSVLFVVILPSKGTRKRNRRFRMDITPGDNGEPVVTIGFPEDF